MVNNAIIRIRAAIFEIREASEAIDTAINTAFDTAFDTAVFIIVGYGATEWPYFNQKHLMCTVQYRYLSVSTV